MGPMYYVLVFFGQFWIRLWFYEFGIDPYLVSEYSSLSYNDKLFRFVNQPMFQYNQKHGFSIMNFIMAALCTCVLLAPVACMVRERQMRNFSSIGYDATSPRKTNAVTPENKRISTD